MMKLFSIVFMLFILCLQGQAQNRNFLYTTTGTGGIVNESVLSINVNNAYNFFQKKDSTCYFTRHPSGYLYYQTSAVERIRVEDARTNFGGIISRYSRVNVLGGIDVDSLIVNTSYIKFPSALNISITPDYILNISSSGIVTRVETKNLKISKTSSDVLTANNATSMTLDFLSELMYTIPFDFTNVSADVNTTINASNLREGGDYTLWYKGSIFKTFTFSSTYFKNPDGTAVAQCAFCAARIYNFKVIGGIAYLKN